MIIKLIKRNISVCLFINIIPFDIRRNRNVVLPIPHKIYIWLLYITMYMWLTSSCIKWLVNPLMAFRIFLMFNIFKFFSRSYNFLRSVCIKKDRWAIDWSLIRLAWYANGRRVSRPFTYRRSSKIELRERVRWISVRYHLIQLYFVSREFVDTPLCHYEVS